MPIPKDYPLESFDPRFEELLLRGARGEDFTIMCKSAAQAFRLQHMLHNYRHRAKKHYGDEQPERWKSLFAAAVGILKDEYGRKTIVHIYSRRNEFNDLLDNIISPSALDLPEDPLDEFEPQNGKPEGSGG